MSDYTATYSPEDNKLRLYACGRLPEEIYARVREAGFRWAPKQDLFVAPSWTPGREDLLHELAGEIGDEDTSLVERAEERAERFESYSANRATDAEAAHAAVNEIAGGIPFGQPILVGHHSERRARRDAQKIENGMRRAIRAWDTANYWTDRAAGAIRSAKYKERPGVRARRIKGLEAERRKLVRDYTPDKRQRPIMQSPFYCPECFPKYNCGCHKHEAATTPVPHVYCGASRGGSWVQVSSLPAIEKANARPIAHLDRRLLYERAMLEADGGTKLLERPKRPKLLPLLNYRAPKGLEAFNPYHRDEVVHYRQVEATKAQLAKIDSDYKGTRPTCDGSHRFRIARAADLEPRTDSNRWAWVAVFLTDSKVHSKSEAGHTQTPKPREIHSSGFPRCTTEPDGTFRTYTADSPKGRAKQAEKFAVMRESLREGVQTVSAPSLFETPPELALEIIRRAAPEHLSTILEPSAGTGRLVRALLDRNSCAHVTAVEYNAKLYEGLQRWEHRTNVKPRFGDFLELDLGTFDRVVMNPPFEKGQDAAHVRHACSLLKPGGRLVAIMSPGPFFRSTRADVEFRDWFEDVGGTVEDLPPDTFKNAGTGVATRLVVIDR